MTAGQRLLRAWLTRSNMSQRRFAELLHKHEVFVGQILSGIRRPSIDTAADIEDLTGVPARSWKPSALDSRDRGTIPARTKRSVANG